MTNKNGAISRAMPIAPVKVEHAEAFNRYFTLTAPVFGKQLVSNTHKGEKVTGLNGLATQIQRGESSCQRSNRTGAVISNAH